MLGTVEFHYGTRDKIGYACRLLRKAYRSGASVAVTGALSDLKALDRQLWVFDDVEFLPHVLAASEQAMPDRLLETAIWLTQDPRQAPGERSILINIGQSLPEGMDRYPRVFDIVSSEEQDRRLGRQRWKAYAGQGWQVNPHEIQE